MNSRMNIINESNDCYCPFHFCEQTLEVKELGRLVATSRLPHNFFKTLRIELYLKRKKTVIYLFQTTIRNIFNLQFIILILTTKIYEVLVEL